MLDYSIFVMMPFQDEYDDVYLVIANAVQTTSQELSLSLSCGRADEFGPGRITDQILAAIQDADIVIADLTGNNPNVMYELGFAHALKKPAIILNQDVHASPFDVKDLRQIVYDRSRLLKDCQPRVISFLRAILAASSKQEISTEVPLTGSMSGPASEPDASADASTEPVRASLSVVAELQAIHLQLEQANAKGLQEQLLRTAARLKALLDRLVVPPGTNEQLVRQLSSGAGNCAVELEEASMFSEAENVYRRGIGLFPNQAGIHLQYADFLIDAARFDEARAEIDRAREVDPTHERLIREEVKLGLESRGLGDDVGKALAAAFDSDPARNGRAYLYFLSQTEAPMADFEPAWIRWNDSLPTNQKQMAKRILADRLATSSDPAEEERALGLYEEMLPSLQGEDRQAVLHNMATLYQVRDAERTRALWTECYRMAPGDERVRISFSQFLSKEGETELAVKVASGDEI
jgi:tetratricopeptide (TPR) repeat protein